MPIYNFQPIRLLDPDCWYKFTYLIANSADPDQLASSEANWSVSTLFAKQNISGFSRTRVKAFNQHMKNAVCLLLHFFFFYLFIYLFIFVVVVSLLFKKLNTLGTCRPSVNFDSNTSGTQGKNVLLMDTHNMFSWGNKKNIHLIATLF